MNTDKKSKEESLLGTKFQKYQEEKYENKNIQDFTMEFFNELFTVENIANGKSLQMYNKIGSHESLLKNLDVFFDTGLVIEKKDDITKRIDKFGRNDPIIKEPKNLYQLCLECFEDPMLKILLVASIVSLIIGVAQQGLAHGWIEGFSIFLAVFIVVSISAVNNLSKEKQFAKLNKENEKKSLNVKRAKKKIEISSEDLLVGDILYLEIGNVVCSDCILLEGLVEIDESALTGESEKVNKNSMTKPFLISGSLVTDGECQAIVCAVGVNSFIGKCKIQMQDSNDKTPLQEKLEDLANKISFIGMVFGVLILAVMVGKEFLIRLFSKEGDGILTSSFLDVIVSSFIIAITVIVVAVPEGLPMAVTIALAFSVMKMKEENNLVRHLDASETMGNVNNICTDKTGTLTEGNMHVRSIYFEGVEKINNSNREENKVSKIKINNNLFTQANLSDNKNLHLLIKSILNNITAYIDNKNQSKEIRGNSTEASLLRLLIDNNVQIDKFLLNNSDSCKLILRNPFKSDNKYMGSIYHIKDSNTYQVFIKGAPEIIFNVCSRVIYEDGLIVNINTENRNSFINKQDDYANASQRTLAFAYQEISDKNYLELDQSNQIFDNILKAKNFTLIGMLGIADPPRPDVKESIKKCHTAGVYVRMVTGDNINTALAIGKEVGILNERELEDSKHILSKNVSEIDIDNDRIYALEGKEFAELSGGYNIKIIDRNEHNKNRLNNDNLANKTTVLKMKKNKTIKKIYSLNDSLKFKKVTQNLKIIARCSPDDKFLLVLGLKELKNIVAVTGDGTNDAPALKKSDVGFAMGKKGTDIAKEASDIILLNDSFSSVVTAIKYGRNVYDCIRKFIQFQLTTNIVAVFMTLFGGLVLKDAPLNAIEMLWVNLIMDSLASLALATEDPTEELLLRKPYPRDDFMVTPSMMKNIITQAIFQIIILTIFLISGDKIFGVPDDRSLSHFEWNETNGYHFTLFFNIFVFLQVFNSINARKLQQDEINVFDNIAGNPIYIAVQAFIVVAQIIIVQFGGRALRVKPLSFSQHLACIIISSSCLLVAYLVKTLTIGKELNVPTENDIMKGLRSESICKLQEKFPSRGRSFRSSINTLMPISHKN